MLGTVILPALALAASVLLWGMVYKLEPHRDQPVIEAVLTGGMDSGGQQVLAPGEIAQERLSFRNKGRSGFQLRIKLCGAEINSKPVLQAGNITDEGFCPVMASANEPEKHEYWTVRGEYLYYRNVRSDDLLMPGRESPAAYSAVQMNAALEPEELESLALIGGDHRIFVLAEVRADGAEDWQELQKSPIDSAKTY